ncbi:uncharacterized protein LOC136025042 isoform X2 [Artemia franciscana]|uniref:uncharacterized protein LOC136025042 isoform X2 n=1 Tax=Artemia franciscana TaxID=6661 RepID=UPI0032DB01EB
METLIRDGTYLNNKHEENFVLALIKDLEHFLSKQEQINKQTQQVFFLPPLPPRFRFLTHQTVESVFFGRLATKSVGESDDRQTAIYCSFDSGPTRGQTRPLSAAAMKEEEKTTKKARKTGVAVYQPPHRRENSNLASTSDLKASVAKNDKNHEKIRNDSELRSPGSPSQGKVRRPDMVVYVPKARRSLEARCSSLALNQENLEFSKSSDHIEDGSSLKIAKEELTKSNTNENNKVSEKLIEVEDALIDSKTETLITIKEASASAAESGNNKSDLVASPTWKNFEKKSSRSRKTSFVPVEEQVNQPTFDPPKPLRKPSINYHGSEINEPSEVWRVEVSELYNGCADVSEPHGSSGYSSADSDKKEEIKGTIASLEEVDAEKLKLANEVFDSESRDFDQLDKKEEDDSWDIMFNDQGEPVKPEVLEELSMALGKTVEVNKPKVDYLSFVPSIADETQFDEELSHVVEFYDFSPSIKTEDLLVIFGGIRQHGGNASFEIKWVDDTHALGVFSSPAAANKKMAAKQREDAWEGHFSPNDPLS